MDTVQVINEILDRLADLDNHAEEYGLDALEVRDVRDSIVCMSDLLNDPCGLEGDPRDVIAHWLFFGGMDSHPRDRLLNWLEELTS